MSAKLTNVTGLQPDWSQIRRQVAGGYISARPHPEDSTLYIYNYTPKAQYDEYWTAETLMCRGLIARGETVLARPFQKFFNLHEIGAENLPADEPVEVFDKLDGSLGILYQFAPKDWRIATRGSFESEQAQVGTELLKKDPIEKWIEPGITYLFEIIYPENRIVVDYGDMKGLVYLGAMNTNTGGWEGLRGSHPAWNYATLYGHSIEAMPESRPNAEGYVLVFGNGFRVKIKHDEYVRLHKILTGVSSTTIWEYLRDGLNFDELIEGVPDEFYDWLNTTKIRLQDEYLRVMTKANEAFASKPDGDRKAIAMHFKQFGHITPILFAMLDGKPYDDIVWKLIKPVRELPFMEAAA